MVCAGFGHLHSQVFFLNGGVEPRNESMNALRSVTWLLRKSMEGILILSLAALGLSILTQIILRAVFSRTFLALDDIIPYSFSLSTFAGAALLFGEGGHIAITIFSDFMPAGIRRAVRVFSGGVTAAFLLFLLYYGYEFMLDGGYQYSPLLNFRLCYIYAIVPLCALSGLLFLAAGRGDKTTAEEP